MDKEFGLRRLQEGDAGALFKALADKRVVRHMASDGFTLEGCKQIVEKSIEHWKRHGIGDYVVLEGQTGSVIGWAGFKLWQEDQFELLVVLSPEFFGLGLKIYLELIERAKNEFGLRHIYCLLPKTRKLFRSIEKLGFERVEETLFQGEEFIKFVRKL